MFYESLKKSAEYIKQKIAHLGIEPELGIILGSGLGKLADEIEGVKIPFSEIPGFQTSTIKGHSGNLVIGEFCSKKIIAMQGRFHFYEGYSLKDVVFPVYVMKLLGVKTFMVTNAAGGINKDFTPGDLMFIEDHINLTGQNPLMGKNIDELGVRFPDMSEAYSRKFVELGEKKASELGLETKKGVYIWLTGPTYETPAEIRMLRTLGGDAVGMSTVPEVIAAKHAGMNVLGISCITNMAAGILDQPLEHSEVIETTTRVQKNFVDLVKKIIEAI